MKTTIQISQKNLSRLSRFKRSSKESYDELLTFILDEYENEILTNEEIDSIKRGLEDIQSGRTMTIQEVAKKYNIKL